MSEQMTQSAKIVTHYVRVTRHKVMQMELHIIPPSFYSEQDSSTHVWFQDWHLQEILQLLKLALIEQVNQPVQKDATSSRSKQRGELLTGSCVRIGYRFKKKPTYQSCLVSSSGLPHILTSESDSSNAEDADRRHRSLKVHGNKCVVFVCQHMPGSPQGMSQLARAVKSNQASVDISSYFHKPSTSLPTTESSIKSHNAPQSTGKKQKIKGIIKRSGSKLTRKKRSRAPKLDANNEIDTNPNISGTQSTKKMRVDELLMQSPGISGSKKDGFNTQSNTDNRTDVNRELNNQTFASELNSDFKVKCDITTDTDLPEGSPLCFQDFSRPDVLVPDSRVISATAGRKENEDPVTSYDKMKTRDAARHPLKQKELKLKGANENLTMTKESSLEEMKKVENIEVLANCDSISDDALDMPTLVLNRKRNLRRILRKSIGIVGGTSASVVAEYFQKKSLDDIVIGSQLNDDDKDLLDCILIEEDSTEFLKVKDEESENQRRAIAATNDVSELTEDQLHFVVQQNETYFRNIFQGKTACERHKDYKKGGKSSGDLTYQVHFGMFQEDQPDIVMAALMNIFCRGHHSYQYLDYLLKVLLPEALIKIYMVVFGITYEDAALKLAADYRKPAA